MLLNRKRKLKRKKKTNKLLNNCFHIFSTFWFGSMNRNTKLQLKREIILNFHLYSSEFEQKQTFEEFGK